MSDTIYHQFKLRMPLDLFKRVEAAATRQNRSVSAEIIHRLTTSLVDAPVRPDSPPSPMDAATKLATFVSLHEVASRQLKNLQSGGSPIGPGLDEQFWSTLEEASARQTKALAKSLIHNAAEQNK